MGRIQMRVLWPILGWVLVTAGCGSEPASGGGYSLRTDTVTTRKPVHVGAVSDFQYGFLNDVAIFRDSGGEPALFGRVSQAALLDSMVLVSDSKNRQTLRAFRLPSGSEDEALQISLVDEGFDSFASEDGSKVFFWKRDGPGFWIQGPGSQSTDPVGVPIRGNPTSRIHFDGITFWAQSVVQGDSRTERLSYRAWEISPDGEILQWVDLPDVIRYQPSFISVFSTGGVRNFPGMFLMDWSPRFGIIEGDNRHYAFTIRRDQTAIDVTADWEPVKLFPDERAWWLERAASHSARNKGIEYGVPEEKPAYRSLSWDGEGRVWVGRYVEGSNTGTLQTAFSEDGPPVLEPVVLDHFSGDGEHLWSIELPHRSRMLDSAGDLILVATRHLEMDNQETISLFRIEPPDGSGQVR